MSSLSDANARIQQLERQVRAMRGLITTGMVFREGIRIQQAIADAGIEWQFGFHDDTDCIHWFLADGAHDERWTAWVTLQASWSSDLEGHEVSPFFWKLDRRYAAGERPKDVRARLFAQGPADTIREAGKLVLAAIRELESTGTP